MANKDVPKSFRITTAMNSRLEQIAKDFNMEISELLYALVLSFIVEYDHNTVERNLDVNENEENFVGHKL